MQTAFKLTTTIADNHQIVLQLPDDAPSGPAEVIVLVSRPVSTASPRGCVGMDRGLVTIADDFDAALPEEVLRDFEGGP